MKAYKIELDPFAMDVNENIVEIYAHLLLLDCETGREISRCVDCADYFIMRDDTGPLFVEDGRTWEEQADDIVNNIEFTVQGAPFLNGHAMRLDFDIRDTNDIAAEMKAVAEEPIDEEALDYALQDWYDNSDAYDEFRDMFDEMKHTTKIG